MRRKIIIIGAGIAGLSAGCYGQMKVVLRIKGDNKKPRERMCLSEHPFGTVKWHHGAHYLLCKGKEKATAELGLSFLAYNMKRAINTVGIMKLIEVMLTKVTFFFYS